MSADRNLLFGILALQMDFVSRDGLIKGMHAWVLEKSKPLAQVLVEQGALACDAHDLLVPLVQKHLEIHGGDAEKSLTAVSSIGPLRAELKQIADADVQASLAHVGTGRLSQAEDLFATQMSSVGTATSAGLRFRILRAHARGGLGAVFVAHDEELHREVALKEIQDRHADHPPSRARFLLEAEITGGLEHPGIVPVYGLGHYPDGRPFYAMRFIRGASLKEAIASFHQGDVPGCDPGQRTLAFRALLGRFVDVCNAMAYAHSRGVLHRDLKPGNIMLGSYGETLVVDWGLAKAVGLPEDQTRPEEGSLRPALASGSAPTQMGQALGTPQYMPPEQAAGHLDRLGPPSDVYSLGATLYCLLTGQAPFASDADGQILQRVCRGEFPAPRRVKRSVPAALEAICLKAMALAPTDRYGSARALADDIEHWLADEPVSAWREPLRVRAGRWTRRHKPLVSGAAAALLVGLAALWAGSSWYQHQQAEAAQRLAATEQAIRQHLDRAQHKRQDLHAEWGKSGGVRTLLNQPERWQAQIQAARSEWQAAQDQAARSEQTLEPDLQAALRKLDQELTRDEADYRLAVRLEKIRLDRGLVVSGDFDYANWKQKREYARAFQQAGLALAPGRRKVVAARIRQSAIKEQLVAALDDWAWLAHDSRDANLCAQLLAAACLTDPDPWRDQVRDLALWQQPRALIKLAKAAQADPKIMTRLSPQLLNVIAYLLPEGKKEKWSRLAQALHPADFEVNLVLASVLNDKKSLDATGFCRAALALRPNSAAAYNNLGAALHNQKDLSGAIHAYKKALAINPKFPYPWHNLGNALYDQNDLPAAIDAYKKALAIGKIAGTWYGLGNALYAQNDLPAAINAYKKAVAINPKFVAGWHNLAALLYAQMDLSAAVDAYKKALAIDPKYAAAWNNLGNALYAQKDLPAAINAYKKALAIDPKLAAAWNYIGVALDMQKDLPAAINAYKKALAIDPKYAAAWYHLGLALFDQKDLPAAITAYKRAIEINPRFALAHRALGTALRDQGDFHGAVAATQHALQLLPKGDSGRTLAEQQLKQCQQFLALEQRLPKAVKAEQCSPAEYLALAELCQLSSKKRYRDAVDFYAKAFAGEPKFAEDMRKGDRYNAACAAALAAAGHDVGAVNLPDKEKSRLRQQTLDWLQADLAARRKLLGRNPKAAAAVRQTLQHWQKDTDLAGVRDAKELVRLPAAEQATWHKLWADVAALLKQAGGK
jgi:serine/threonine protein kinase/lipoprotein NlpI